jgi:hypothetical protein
VDAVFGCSPQFVLIVDMKGLRQGVVAVTTEKAISTCVQAENNTPSKLGSVVKNARKKKWILRAQKIIVLILLDLRIKREVRKTYGRRIPKAAMTMAFCDSGMRTPATRKKDIPNIATSEIMLNAVMTCHRTSCNDTPLVCKTTGSMFLVVYSSCSGIAYH